MNKKRTILVFDTETTGLPKDWSAPVEQVDNWPRIIQLAWALYDEDGNLLESFSKPIKPDGWVVPKEKFWIDNGHSTERCEAEGVAIADALAVFIVMRMNADFSVAHNMSFDGRILRAEMIRLGLTTEFTAPKICTMKSSAKYVGLPRNKWPKLEELHRFLFNCEFEGAHDAGADVAACAKCLFELIKREIILLPIEEIPVVDQAVTPKPVTDAVTESETGRVEPNAGNAE